MCGLTEKHESRASLELQNMTTHPNALSDSQAQEVLDEIDMTVLHDTTVGSAQSPSTKSPIKVSQDIPFGNIYIH